MKQGGLGSPVTRCFIWNSCGSPAAPFHVKQNPADVGLLHLKGSLTIKAFFRPVEGLFPDAEIPKDHVKNILDIHPPNEPAK